VKVTARIESGATPFFLDQISNPVSNDTRLPRPGSGEDQHRPLRSLHGGALFRIQLFDKMLQEVRIRRENILPLVYRL